MPDAVGERSRRKAARSSTALVSLQRVEQAIYVIRGRRVMLDSDLAGFYGVATGALNRAVKRNQVRFPPDFCFQLTADELARLKCQTGISNVGRGGRRSRPYAFTEHGAIIAVGQT